MSKVEYRKLINGKRKHGFAYTPKKQLSASAGTASYYAWSPKRGLRFISLDTVGEGGGRAATSTTRSTAG